MFKEEFNKVAGAASAKNQLLKNNKLGYFISSMLAGIYVGMAIMLIFTIGGLLTAAGSAVWPALFLSCALFESKLPDTC